MLASGNDAIDRVAGWWPRGARRDDPTDVAAVAAVRALVVTASPATPQVAQEAASNGWGIVSWRRDREPDLDLTDLESLITDDLIAAYLADTEPGGLGARPSGSQSSVTSYLRRLVPGHGGLAATRHDHGPRLAARAAATGGRIEEPKNPVAALRLDGPVQLRLPDTISVAVDPHLGRLIPGWPHLEPAVADIIAATVPTALASDLWELVAPLTRAAVARLAPGQPGRARQAVNVVAYLAAWVATQRRPVRSDVILVPSTMTKFLRTWQASPDRPPDASLATYRTLLRAVGEAVHPDLDFSVLPRYSRVKARAAATDAQVTQGLAWADLRVNKGPKRYSRAAVVLARGAGVDPASAPWVQHGHLSDDGEWLDLHTVDADGRFTFVRTAFVVPAYRQALRAVFDAAAKAGDEFVLGGPPTRRAYRLSYIASSAPTPPPVSFAQLRNAWLVEVIEGRYLDLFEFMDAAGLATLRVVDDLFDAPGRRAASSDDELPEGDDVADDDGPGT